MNMSTYVSINVIQAYNEIICIMYIPLTFQLIIKRFLFFQASCILLNIPTNQPHHILFKNHHNCLHSITHPFYFHHHSSSFTITPLPPTQYNLLDQHNLYPLPSISSHLLQTTHIIHPLSQFFTNFPSLPTHTTYTPHPNPHSIAPFRLPVILQAMLAHSRMRDCTFLFMVGRCHPNKPYNSLAPTIIDS